jgi:hypothetical protein
LSVINGTQEANLGPRLFVVQHLHMGEAGGVVDADVDALPASAPAWWVRLPITRCPVPISIRTSFLMSMWISSPGRARSVAVG